VIGLWIQNGQEEGSIKNSRPRLGCYAQVGMYYKSKVVLQTWHSTTSTSSESVVTSVSDENRTSKMQVRLFRITQAFLDYYVLIKCFDNFTMISLNIHKAAKWPFNKIFE